jgi:hypothetical protein
MLILGKRALFFYHYSMVIEEIFYTSIKVIQVISIVQYYSLNPSINFQFTKFQISLKSQELLSATYWY